MYLKAQIANQNKIALRALRVTEVPSMTYFKFLLGFDLRQDLQRNLGLIINHSGS